MRISDWSSDVCSSDLDGWVKGEGFVRPASEADPLTEPPRFVDIGEEYVRQIVDLSPGQRKRYLGHLRVLEVTRIRGSLIFTNQVTAITDDRTSVVRGKSGTVSLVLGGGVHTTK